MCMRGAIEYTCEGMDYFYFVECDKKNWAALYFIDPLIKSLFTEFNLRRILKPLLSVIDFANLFLQLI